MIIQNTSEGKRLTQHYEIDTGSLERQCCIKDWKASTVFTFQMLKDIFRCTNRLHFYLMVSFCACLFCLFLCICIHKYVYICACICDACIIIIKCHTYMIWIKRKNRKLKWDQMKWSFYFLPISSAFHPIWSVYSFLYSKDLFCWNS